MNLKMWQEHFVHSLITNSKNEELEKLIIPAGSLTREDALNVYRQDYQARMKEALASNYEATWLVLGDEEFFSLSEEYISKHPSSYDNLTNYGDLFPQFLRTFSQEASEMAEFEKAFWKYFHAEDRPSIKLNSEIVIQAKFNLSEITFIASEIRLDLLWSKRLEKENILQKDNLYEESFYALYKREDKVEIAKLTKLEYEVLQELSICLQISCLSERGISTESWSRIFNLLQFSSFSI